MHPNHTFTLLYDGNCPICRKEVAWLRSRNKRNKLQLLDIHTPSFDPNTYGKSIAELMAEIHGVYPDGRVVKGMPVFYAAYSAVGLGWLMAPTRWPLLAPLFDRLYSWFAKHRLSLGALFNNNPCRENTCGLEDKTEPPNRLDNVEP